MEVPVFQPSEDEFSRFNDYVEFLESQTDAGMARVIPPSTWRSLGDFSALENVVIHSATEQCTSGQQGIIIF